MFCHSGLPWSQKQEIGESDTVEVGCVRNISSFDKCQTDDMANKKEDIHSYKEKDYIVPKAARKPFSICDAEKRSSADLFNDYSDDDGLSFPLSQVHDKNCKSVVTRQTSQASTNSDMIKLLNVTPDIIEETDGDSPSIDFSKLIDENLQEGSMHCGEEGPLSRLSTLPIQNAIAAKPTPASTDPNSLATSDLKTSKEKSVTKARSKKAANKKNKVDENTKPNIKDKGDNIVITEEAEQNVQSVKEDIIAAGTCTRRTTRASKVSKNAKTV